MVEKLIHISEREEEAIASLAQNLGLSEAEVVRRALAELLENRQSQLVSQSSRVAALKRFLDLAEETSKKHHLPEGYRFNRAELYEEEDLAD